MEIISGARISRFGLVGGISTLLYGGVALVLHHSFGMPLLAASLAAYAAASVFSYAGHKYFTFRSQARHSAEMRRFAVLSIAGAAVAGLLPALLAGWSQTATIFLTCLVIPAVNYAVLSLWVFASAAWGET